MCRSTAEGGRRCADHRDPTVRNARRRAWSAAKKEWDSKTTGASLVEVCDYLDLPHAPISTDAVINACWGKSCKGDDIPRNVQDALWDVADRTQYFDGGGPDYGGDDPLPTEEEEKREVRDLFISRIGSELADGSKIHLHELNTKTSDVPVLKAERIRKLSEPAIFNAYLKKASSFGGDGIGGVDYLTAASILDKVTGREWTPEELVDFAQFETSVNLGFPTTVSDFETSVRLYERVLPILENHPTSLEKNRWRSMSDPDVAMVKVITEVLNPNAEVEGMEDLPIDEDAVFEFVTARKKDLHTREKRMMQSHFLHHYARLPVKLRSDYAARFDAGEDTESLGNEMVKDLTFWTDVKTQPEKIRDRASEIRDIGVQTSVIRRLVTDPNSELHNTKRWDDTMTAINDLRNEDGTVPVELVEAMLGV